MDMDQITSLLLIMPMLMAEEDGRSLEINNYADFNKDTQKKIRAKLEKPFAKSINPSDLIL